MLIADSITGIRTSYDVSKLPIGDPSQTFTREEVLYSPLSPTFTKEEVLYAPPPPPTTKYEVIPPEGIITKAEYVAPPTSPTPMLEPKIVEQPTYDVTIAPGVVAEVTPADVFPMIMPQTTVIEEMPEGLYEEEPKKWYESQKLPFIVLGTLMALLIFRPRR